MKSGGIKNVILKMGEKGVLLASSNVPSFDKDVVRPLSTATTTSGIFFRHYEAPKTNKIKNVTGAG
jgi:sugar/nucleoside kinase (ribokinase family)